MAGTIAPPLELDDDELLELEEDELLELELDEELELEEELLELELDEELEELEELELELLDEPESDPEEPPPHAATIRDNDKTAIAVSDRRVCRYCMLVSVIATTHTQRGAACAANLRKRQIRD